MDLWHKFLIGLAIILTVLALIAATSYVGAREDKIRAEVQQSADKKTLDLKDQQLNEQKAAFDKQTAAFEEFKRDQDAKMTALQTQFATAKTPDQNAVLTAALLKLAGGDVKVGGTQEKPTLEVPIANLHQYEQACEECKLNLETATHQLDLAKRREAVNADELQFAKDQDAFHVSERDSYKKTAAGGGFWSKFKRTVETAAIVGFSAYALGRAHR